MDRCSLHSPGSIPVHGLRLAGDVACACSGVPGWLFLRDPKATASPIHPGTHSLASHPTLSPPKCLDPKQLCQECSQLKMRTPPGVPSQAIQTGGFLLLLLQFLVFLLVLPQFCTSAVPPRFCSSSRDVLAGYSR